MSIKAIDYKIILKRDGQTQQQRMSQWLDPSLVQVDARTKEDYFNYLKALAKEIKFYELQQNDNSLTVNGTWEDFFNLNQNELLSLATQASLPSHIALWNAFIELYEKPKGLMNMLSKRHLDFYYGEVLRLMRNNAAPDKVHVVFELKKNSADTLLKAGTSLLAGKDNTKKDLHYKLTHDIVVNKSKIAYLKSLYVNPLNKNYIHYAPVANSADGLGGELDKANSRWPAFGNSNLPLAQIGFCLASNVLKMKEGERTVKVNLTMGNLPSTAKNTILTNNLFVVSITGEKGWIGPKTVSVIFTSSDDKVFNASFQFAITKDEAAVVAYDAKIHGRDFNTSSPLLQVLLNNEKSDFGYKELQDAELRDAIIEVNVTNAKDLQLENDLGTLNASKPFAPFGSSPDANANFSIKNEEAFTKRLKEFSVDVEWKNIPASDLNTYFKEYGLSNNRNQDFTAMASFHDAFTWQGSQRVNLFDTLNAGSGVTWKFINGVDAPRITHKIIPEIPIKQNKTAGWTVAQKLTSNLGQLVPALSTIKPMKSVKTSSEMVLLYIESQYAPVVQGWINRDNDKRTGMLNLSLQHGFLFKEYRQKYTENILAFSTGADKTISVIKEPFAPEIQSIKFNYTASTVKTNFTDISLNDFVDNEVELFHYGAFGQMREHAYQKSQHAFLNNSIVKLLPEYENEGEFYIGLSGLLAEDAVCVLFQVAEGSADPDKPKIDLKWSVLCDNYWKELTNEDFIFDSTNDFLTSGVIKFVIPGEATIINTIMPNNLLWLRAAIRLESNAVCDMLDVQSNAAIAIFDNQDNDPLHLATPLVTNSIKKLENEVAAIKPVKQLYASFGGQMQENSQAYYIRASERLRHKERSISLWDYERLLLQHFPKIHKVKCINHASDTSFYEPGNILVILVPDLTNQNAVNPFQPRVDKNTVNEVKTFLETHSTVWAEHHVRNPFYEPIKISVSIKLKTGFEFNYYQKIIDRKLQEFLSPWINNSASDIHFGGKVTKSMIVKYLEDLEFADFITDLRLFHSINNGNSFGSNVEIVEASNPASILVSYDHHEIFNY